MSFRALVIPEDPTYNGVILKPLVSRLRECGRPQAKVTVLRDPKVTGYDDAIRSLPWIARKYQHFDILLFLPDLDGKDAARKESLRQLERTVSETESVRLVCCAAEQEVEVWALAGFRDRLGVKWDNVRVEVALKERIFEPFIHSLGYRKREDKGRAILIAETLTNWRSLVKLCPELAQLEDRVRTILA